VCTKRPFVGAFATAIRRDVRVNGRHSGVERQIDILVGVEGLIAVECKCYARRVDVKLVEMYLGMLDDLGVCAGILVTTKGYSRAALNRAQNDPRDIDLQIIHPDRLSEYQHVGAPLIYRGDLGISLAPPPFWVVDVELVHEPGGALVMMYPLGQPPGLTFTHIMERGVPFAWADQRAKFGFA
jgi:hypothetical protein